MSTIFTLEDSNLGLLHIHYEDEQCDKFSVFQHLKSQKCIGWDCETTWNEQNKEDWSAGVDPFRSRIRLTQFATEDGHVYLFDHFKISSEVKDEIKDLLESILPVKIAHNAKFDIKMARKHLNVQRLGKIFCSDIGYRLTKCGQYPAGKVSLLDAVSEFLGFTLKKELQLSDWSLPELSKEQLIYSAIDAYVLIPLRKEILNKIKELKIEYAAKIDFDVLDPICELELTGFPINSEKWIEVDKKTKEKRMNLIEQINDELRATVVPQQGLFPGAPLESHTSKRTGRVKQLKKPSLAIGSADKVKHLLEAYGIILPEKVDRKSRKKSKTTGTPFLAPLANKFAIIKPLLQFRELDKRKSSYGEEYIRKYVHPLTGRIHADFDPQGTKTSRFSNNKPNLQQIPKLKEYRSCFEAPEGWKFVGGDFSQIELRIAAELSKESGYIEAFLSGVDFHDGTTVVMFGLPAPPYDKDTPERKEWDKTPEGQLFDKMRGYAKNINFGIIYGMGAGKLALSTGLPENKDSLMLELIIKDNPEKYEKVIMDMYGEGLRHWQILKQLRVEDMLPESLFWKVKEEAQKINTAQDYLDKYYEKFPDLMEWLKEQATKAAIQHQIRMASGRLVKFWVNHDEKWSVAQAERNGMNTPIQGLSAEITKIALRLVFDEIYNSGLQAIIKPCHTVHDEIQLLAKEQYATQAEEILKKNMVKAGEIFLKAVPVRVETKISQVWEK